MPMTHRLLHSADAGDAAGFDWGTIQWLVSEKLIPGAAMTFGIVEIKAGVSNPTHLHPNCDEILFLIEGTLDHRLGDEIIPMRPGDAIYVPMGVIHGAFNTGASAARMVVAFSSGDRQTVFSDERGVAY
jgi:mannose-6-phosphate isomerase-like protein (cupin superfamily)